MSIGFCSLCHLELSFHPIIDDSRNFCCHGCLAVYNILSSKQLLANYQETPIFHQAVKAGLISNPNLLEHIRKRQENREPQELEKFPLEIMGMWCPSCAEVIRLVLLQHKGVLNCVVDYSTDLAAIEFSPRDLSKEKILEIIASLGYEPHTLENSSRRKVSLDLYLRFGVAAFCALNAMMFAYPLYATYFEPAAYEDGKIFAWLTFLSSLPVITYCMRPILQRFYSGLKLGLIGMEALVVIGVSAAFGLSLYQLFNQSNTVYFDSMNVIVTFVLLGKIIESKAKFSAKESLFRLNKLLPRRGRKRLLDGQEAFVPIKEIVMGDILIAYGGEKIIVDGEVIEGEGVCDESLVTGEAFPVSKKKGSKIIGGALLQHGALIYQVIRTAEESTLQKIIRIVEQDLNHKSVYIRAADYIARWFVPLVFLIASSTAIGGWFFYQEDALLRAVSVLLIACPCAIGIAAPLAESHILHRLADKGVIVRNRGCLTLLPAVTTFVFDKTGTVTHGDFRVLDGLQILTNHEKRLLKSLTKPSNHLISKAIYQTIEEEGLNLDSVEECIGNGMKGYYLNKIAMLGSLQFLKGQDIKGLPSQPLASSHSIVYFTPDGEKIYPLLLGDCIRKEISEVLKLLIKEQKETILLSGDSFASVKAVAEQCGFQTYFSHKNPLQKKDFIEDLRNQGKIVCMIGDGINDAPALTAAHIGISVVSATDVSIQVSDLLLTTDRLNVLPEILHIAKKGGRILKQNLFWAFFYNIIGIGLAINGLLSPIFAAFAMTISSLIVLFNSKRV